MILLCVIFTASIALFGCQGGAPQVQRPARGSADCTGCESRREDRDECQKHEGPVSCGGGDDEGHEPYCERVVECDPRCCAYLDQ